MPHVSRISLKKEVEEELAQVLLDSLVAIDRKELAREVVADLLTPTEKIMLAKRLLAAMLLEEGYGYSEITRTLRLTPTTVNHLKITLAKSGRGFRALIELLKGSRRARADQRRKEARREEVANKIGHVIERLRLPVKGSKRDMARWRRAMETPL